jgi:hypothetical protein
MGFAYQQVWQRPHITRKRTETRTQRRQRLAPVTIRSPRNRPGKETRLDLWAVRIWEPKPDPNREPIEWLLLTSVPVETFTDALERVDWYTHRWGVEKYHNGLKTGCRIENRRLQKAQRLHPR